MTCQQKHGETVCGLPAAYRFTWPGKPESYVCGACESGIRAIADAIGLPLQMIAVSSAGLIGDFLRNSDSRRHDDQGQWTLGQLIDALKARPQDQDVRFDFCGVVPGRASSYRGYYEQLAIEPADEGKRRKVADFLAELEGCVGKIFEGYKGGSYCMKRETPMWVAAYGESWQTAIVGLAPCDWATVITTAYVE